MEIINFTPMSATIGGVLIGLSAALFLALNGRVTGISGIAGGLLVPVSGDRLWRALFIAGLILGGVIYRIVSGWGESSLFIGVDHIQAVASPVVLVIAGLLVGVGTTLGSGCTSGHGICGLARQSPRSLVATLTFVATGFITVAVVKLWIGA